MTKVRKSEAAPAHSGCRCKPCTCRNCTCWN